MIQKKNSSKLQCPVDSVKHKNGNNYIFKTKNIKFRYQDQLVSDIRTIFKRFLAPKRDFQAFFLLN